MIFNVHLLAFADDKVRPVDVPVLEAKKAKNDIPKLLELIFYYGQNDFQPVDGCYSVSVGDVVQIPVGDDWEYHRVIGIGFKKMTTDEFEAYKALPQDERYKIQLGM